MTKPRHRHKSLFDVTEPNFAKADEVLSIVGAYKGRKRLPTMIDALWELVRKADQ